MIPKTGRGRLAELSRIYGEIHPVSWLLQVARVIEGINSLVQAAKAKARGYRSTRNLKAMVYLIAGKLNLRLPV